MKLAALSGGMALAAATAVVAPAAAQEAAAAQEPAASHLAAAVELLELMDTESAIRTGAMTSIDGMIAQNPQLAGFRDLFEEFISETMAWDSIRPEFARMYADAFTEAELRELAGFYRTPVGQKTVKLMPELMVQGAAIGERRTQARLPELQRRVQQRLDSQ